MNNVYCNKLWLDGISSGRIPCLKSMFLYAVCVMLSIPQYTGAGEVAERSRGARALVKPTGALSPAYPSKYGWMRNAWWSTRQIIRFVKRTSVKNFSFWECGKAKQASNSMTSSERRLWRVLHSGIQLHAVRWKSADVSEVYVLYILKAEE
jgi:hypothetical protein